ncbi:MAG: hypothetical protein ABJQ34_10555 [Paracoccaceae bacterium]
MKIHVTLELSEQLRTFELQGRLGWTMAQLVAAGAKGFRAIDNPSPRTSAYVHSLREMGIPIETVMEDHDGPYPGKHGVNFLTCDARVRSLDTWAFDGT